MSADVHRNELASLNARWHRHINGRLHLRHVNGNNIARPTACRHRNDEFFTLVFNENIFAGEDALRRRFASRSSLWLSVLVAVVALLLAWMMGGAAPEAAVAAVEAAEAAVGEAVAAAA